MRYSKVIKEGIKTSTLFSNVCTESKLRCGRLTNTGSIADPRNICRCCPFKYGVISFLTRRAKIHRCQILVAEFYDGHEEAIRVVEEIVECLKAQED